MTMKPRQRENNPVLVEILGELRAMRRERAPSVVQLATHDFALSVQNHSLKRATRVARGIYNEFKERKNIKRIESR